MLANLTKKHTRIDTNYMDPGINFSLKNFFPRGTIISKFVSFIQFRLDEFKVDISKVGNWSLWSCDTFERE